MLYIQTKIGSATSPKPEICPIVIGHIVNNVNGWGKGFVLAVSKLSKAPEAAYHAWGREGKLLLGNTQFVEAEPNVIIANMVAQNGYANNHADGVAVNYPALAQCLETTFRRAIQLGANANFPIGMGSGLAGGDKDRILALIKKVAESTERAASQFGVANLNITLWEFDDTTASSYVPTTVGAKTDGALGNTGVPQTVVDDLEDL